MNIGIDLGGSHIAAGLVTNDGELLGKSTIPSSLGRSYEDLMADSAELCRKLLYDSGMNIGEIKSIGIGMPGAANNASGTVTCPSTLKFYNVPIREEFRKHLDFDVQIENDANCAALGESISGAARGSQTSVTITLGTGLGGGIIIDGKIFSGFNFAGSEMGHMVIVLGGNQCSCGRKGCWEAYSSATALVESAVRALEEEKNSEIYKLAGGDISKINGKLIFDAAKKCDPVAQKVLGQYVTYLAEGIANIINIIMPEVFVIGGGVGQQGDYLLNLLEPEVSKLVYDGGCPGTTLKTAELGNDAGIIGAAMLGR